MTNVMFYSRKGGQGKTTSAIGYTHHSGANYYTNDYGNSTIDIYSPLFGEGVLHEFKPGEKFKVDSSKSAVFDFGGFLDNRIIAVAKLVDVCVVPIFFQSAADLKPAVKTVVELGKYNKNIVILINNTEKDNVELLVEALSGKFDYEIFIVNRSRYIARLADEKKTVFQLAESGGVKKFQLRNLIPQVEKFYSYLDNCE